MHTNWRPARNVFVDALAMLRAHLGTVAVLWLAEIVLMLVVAALVILTTTPEVTDFALVFGFVIIFVYRLVSTMVLMLVSTGRKSRPLSAVLREGVLLKLPAAVGLTVLVGIAVSVASAAFLLPGVLLYTFWSMSLMILVVEDTSVRLALRGSVELVRGWFWPVLSRFVFVFVILTLLALLAVIPGIGSMVASILSFVLTPVLVFYYIRTYQELVENKRYQHLQRAQVPLLAKIAIVLLALFTAILFAAIGAIAPSINDVMRAAADRAPKEQSRNYQMSVDEQGQINLPTGLLEGETSN